MDRNKNADFCTVYNFVMEGIRIEKSQTNRGESVLTVEHMAWGNNKNLNKLP